MFFHPLACIVQDRQHAILNAQIGYRLNDQVHVIWKQTNSLDDEAMLAANCVHVVEKTGRNHFVEERYAMLGGEHYMVVQQAQTMFQLKGGRFEGRVCDI